LSLEDHPNSSKVGKHSLYADKLNPTVLPAYSVGMGY